MALEQSGQQSSKHSWLQDRNPTAKSLQTTDYILVFSNCRHSEVISSCVPKDAQRCNIQASIPQRTRMAGKGSSSPLGFRGWQIIVGSIRGFAVLRGLLKCIAPNLFPQYAVIGLAWETSGTRESRARQGWGGPAHGIPSVTENEQWRCSTCYCDEDLGAQLGCISALHISASQEQQQKTAVDRGRSSQACCVRQQYLMGSPLLAVKLPCQMAPSLHWNTGAEVLRECVWACDWSAISFLTFHSSCLSGCEQTVRLNKPQTHWQWAAEPLISLVYSAGPRASVKTSLVQELPVFPALLSELPTAPPTPRHLHSITLNLITESKFCLATTLKGPKTNAAGHKLLYLILPPDLPQGFFPVPVMWCWCQSLCLAIYIRNLVINHILWGFKESC